MEKIIIARYGEIGIKSSWVRMEFEKQLADNISRALIENKIGLEKIRQKGARTYIWCENIPRALKVLKNVFGVVSYSQAQAIETDIDIIKKTALQLFKKSKKKVFRVTTRRVFKKFPFSSMDVNAQVGAYILENSRAKVSMKKYQVELGIEITKNKTFVFSETQRGPGGLPIGAEGKVVCVVENKNSFFNAFLMAKRGCEVLMALTDKSLLTQAKSFYKKYHYFKEEPVITKIDKKNLGRGVIDFAKKEGAKAIISEEKRIGYFEKYTDFPVYYPFMGYSTRDLRNFLKN